MNCSRSGQVDPAHGHQQRGTAWFGGQVLDGLCTVLDEHLAERVAVGRHRCVPWLTSDAVIDRLAKLNSLCVVLDKGRKIATR